MFQPVSIQPEATQKETMATAQWFADLKSVIKSIVTAMANASYTDSTGTVHSTAFGVAPSSEIITAVDNVNVSFTVSEDGSTIIVGAGLDANNLPYFTWNVPLAWAE